MNMQQIEHRISDRIQMVVLVRSGPKYSGPFFGLGSDSGCDSWSECRIRTDSLGPNSDLDKANIRSDPVHRNTSCAINPTHSVSP